MRLTLAILCLLVASLACDARRRRKSSKNSAGTRRTKSGRLQRLSSDLNNSTALEGDTNLAERLMEISPTTEDAESTRVRSPRRRSKNKRKGKKHRKGRNGKRTRKDDTAEKYEESAFHTNDNTRKELLRSTMRHMFGFEHMAAPRGSLTHLQDVETVFDISSSSESRESNRRSEMNSHHHQQNENSHRILPNPPDFMLELYRTYSEDKSLMLINAQSQGNTIRSFFSVAGETPNRLRDKGKPMIIIPYLKVKRPQGEHVTAATRHIHTSRQKMRVFAFNVTSIPSTESIVAAELRLDGLRNAAINAAGSLKSQNISRSEWSADISVYRVAESENDTNDTRNVYQRIGRLITMRPSSSFAWVDGHIARLASAARQRDHILIVKFNHHGSTMLTRRRRRSAPSTDNLSSVSSLTSEDTTLGLPAYFVVMGTDRRKRNSGINHSHRSSGSSSSSLSLTPILIVYCNDTETIVPTASDVPVTNGIWSTLGNLTASDKNKRVRRSANRRLADAPLSPSNDETRNELPGETRLNNDNARTTTRYPAIANNDQTEMHDDGRSERRVIQQLQDRKTLAQSKKGKKRKRGRKCRRRGRKGKKWRRCRKEQSVPIPEPALNRAQQVCSRKSLHVDFNDIGWADWIISPKNFDAYYCSGSCELNTMKKIGPSNHAIIQAFIKSFGFNPGVPAPCCVPEKLMSLSVLFFDRNDNVVLKVYPNMSVETCACR